MIVRALLALALVLGIPLASMAVVQAYNNYDNPPKYWDYPGSGDLELTYKFDSSVGDPSDWRTAFNWAKTDWDNAGTVVDFVPDNGGGDNVFNTYNDDDGNYGITVLYFSASYIVGSEAKGNLYNDPGTDIGRREIAGHELGHVIGLGYSTASVSLMNEDALDPDESYPQTDDVSGVGDIY